MFQGQAAEGDVASKFSSVASSGHKAMALLMPHSLQPGKRTCAGEMRESGSGGWDLVQEERRQWDRKEGREGFGTLTGGTMGC